MTIDQVRKYFAGELQVVCGLKSPRLVEALSRVPRERFLGPGPWLVRGEFDTVPRSTGSADPCSVYHNVSVAIDAARDLFNGQPGLVARWLDDLQIGPGQRVLHIGCATGYYTALLAEMVGETGQVFAIEIDPTLATRAQENLADWPWVQVAQGDGRSSLPGDIDVLLVHAGATHVLEEWLDTLRDGGRLLVPLTSSGMGTPAALGKGAVLLARRAGDTWSAKMTTMVMIYSLIGARDAALDARLAKAFMAGAWRSVVRLRRDTHDPAPSCWLHGPRSCLSA